MKRLATTAALGGSMAGCRSSRAAQGWGCALTRAHGGPVEHGRGDQASRSPPPGTKATTASPPWSPTSSWSLSVRGTSYLGGTTSMPTPTTSSTPPSYCYLSIKPQLPDTLLVKLEPQAQPPSTSLTSCSTKGQKPRHDAKLPLFCFLCSASSPPQQEAPRSVVMFEDPSCDD